MKEINRKDLHIISKHSNMDEQTLSAVLKEKIFASKQDWQKFLKLLFLTLAIGFSVTGIIFFFAYNWDELNKFIKMAIPQVFLVGSVIFILTSKSSLEIKNIVLTGASMLVGALFAVFGQIYQTGANAYDFFLGWTVFITLWVILANYSPLWLLYSVLINITFHFYSQQVANNWSLVSIAEIFLLLNLIPLVCFLLLKRYKTGFTIASWYSNILAVACTVFVTFLIISLKERDTTLEGISSLILIAGSFALGTLYARYSKNIFYLALIALSIIVSIIYYSIDSINDTGAILLLSIFCLVSFSLVIKLLLTLQKDWNNEK